MSKREFYHHANESERKKLLVSLPRIYQAVNYFSDNFFNKRIFIWTENGKLELNIQKKNILHLLGIDYERGTKQFFTDFKRHQLDVKKIKVKNDHTTFKKIGASQHLEDLFKKDNYLTDEGIFIHLQYKHALRTKRDLVAIAMDKDEKTNFYPKSLLNLQYFDMEKGKEILAIYTIDKKDKELKILKLKDGYELDEETHVLKPIGGIVQEQQSFANM